MADQPTQTPLILVADDDEDILGLLSNALSREGYEVITAVDGEQALALALERRPALVILDLVMPKLYGYSVLRKLKENKETNNTPVIMLTARTDPEEVLRGLEIGAADYLEKPFQMHRLLGRVREMLE